MADTAGSSEGIVFGLFEVYGLEVEYMIVDARTLDPVPACDWLLTEAAGELTDEFENGTIAWNNELALHVVEFKTNGPVTSLDGVAAAFQGNVREANRLLGARGLRLLPTAMHPWLDPHRDIRLWPYGQREIYRAFDRIFDCRGHGWGNLQSLQINLPFANDAEFFRLHSAVRMVLPLIPGLAASSPVVDGVMTGHADNRLRAYRSNCRRFPSVTGDVIPEPVADIRAYHRDILGRIYRDLEEVDPQGVLRHEWVNARGAIARFDRMAVEIRVIDSQECPAADVAVADLVSAVVRTLSEERWASLAPLAQWPQRDLARLLELCIEEGEAAEVGDVRLLRVFGYGRSTATLTQLWGHLAEAMSAGGYLRSGSEPAIERYLAAGTLSRRIRRALPPNSERGRLRDVYARLADCLEEGHGFAG